METKTIELTKGKVAKVSHEDWEVLSQHKWHLTANGYAARSGVHKERIYMHRVINQTPLGMSTDHRDGDTLNNTRENLRTCTQSQNLMNSRKARGLMTSQFKGVSFRPPRGKRSPNGCWHACLKHGGKLLHFGNYVSELDAALAFNIKAKELFGDFAKLNDIPLDFLRDNPEPKRFLGRASKYRGVSWSKPMKKWLAYVCVKATRVHASFHETQEQAALAYNTAALQHHGPEAKLNQLHAI